MRDKILKWWYMTILVIALIGAIVWMVAFIGYRRGDWDMVALDVAKYGIYAVGAAFIGAIVPAIVWVFSTTNRLHENIPPPPK